MSSIKTLDTALIGCYPESSPPDLHNLASTPWLPADSEDSQTPQNSYRSPWTPLATKGYSVLIHGLKDCRSTCYLPQPLGDPGLQKLMGHWGALFLQTTPLSLELWTHVQPHHLLLMNHVHSSKSVFPSSDGR